MAVTFVPTDQHYDCISHAEAVWEIESLLDEFAPITLAEMSDVSLLNRVDTKYVFGISQLYSVLEGLTTTYRVLDIQQIRLNHYLTLYFDTLDFRMYNDHHNRYGTRYKVRARKYVDSDLSFLEVKHKTNQHRTIKSRIQIPDVCPHMDTRDDNFVIAHTPYTGHNLEPKLWNDYLRMTLVSTQDAERVTLDLNVSFFWGRIRRALPGVVIAEVKQRRFSPDSEFKRQMRRRGIRPMRFSKYTAGVYNLYDGVKTNTFKPRIRFVNKLMKEENNA